MWIALAIVGFLAALIIVILMLPVKIILRNDENDPLILRYRFLFKTFGEDPDPNNPIIRALKTATGVDRLEGENVKKSIQEGGLQKTITDSYAMLANLVKEVVVLLKRGKLSFLKVKILCTGSDVDETALHYGQCCAATYGLLNLLRSFIKVRKRNCDIDVACGFFQEKPIFRYELVLSFRVGRVIAGLWRAALAEAKRMGMQQNGQQK